MLAWWRPPRGWYMLSVSEPGGPPSFYGPAYLSRPEADEWMISTMEARWGSDVRRYSYTAGRWVLA